jgi:signal transduction histidine kinase/ligand-binding sensor domain-containing protein/DNA-binding response OmpR family regulator
MFEDYKGMLWVNTRNGFNIYNPSTESFHHDTKSEACNLGNCYITISNMIKCINGNYFIYSPNPSLFYYIPEKKYTLRINYLPSDTMKSDAYRITSLIEDKDTNVWIITSNGILIKLNKKLKIDYYNYYLYNTNNKIPNSYILYCDTDNDLWIAITNDAKGIYFFDSKKNTFQHYTTNSSPIKLNNNIITGVTQDNNGIIWIGTDHGGINLINKKLNTINYLLQDPDNDKSITQNSINTIYKDNTGIIWIGTFKQGINYYHEEIIRFNSYRHIASDNNSLGFDDIHCFAEDKSGNLWIGTNGGGIDHLDRKTGIYKHYRHEASNPKSLSNDIIVDLHVDHLNNLWIGTFYGGLNFFDGKIFKHYKHNPNDPRSISDNRVWCVYEDRDYNIWVGTLGGGLDLFDREKNIFYHYKAGQVNSVHSNYIINIIEDKDKNIWIGTAEGLDVLDKKTGRFINYVHEEANPNSLSNNNITTLKEDSYGNIWIGTREGLNKYNRQKNNFLVIRQPLYNLPDNAIMAILEDSRHNLWISTMNGITNMIIHNRDTEKETYIFRNYDEADGLQGREFNVNSAIQTKFGELIFGGSNGYNLFVPEMIKENKRIPEVIITDLKIMNESVKVNEKIHGRVILKNSVSITKEVVLKYSENMFSIEFTAFNYFHAEKNMFKYILEGFNNEWIYTDGKTRKATYTNLDPGKYTFRVLASNNDGYWNTNGASLTIIIQPPFWRTNFAIILYILTIAGILLLLRAFIIEKERIKYKVHQQKLESEKQHEIDNQKLKIITNISHEFKTPLTLILAALENVQRDSRLSNQKINYQVIFRNAKRLLNLVNQLLDFRKLSAKSMELNLSLGDIVDFIKSVSESFIDLAEKKNISFEFKTNTDELYTFFDHDKIEKVIFNLLSNAYKFTPENGKVAVEINSIISENINVSSKDAANNNWIEIKVKDTGIGISPDKHEKIFEEFFQDIPPDTITNHGTGIGLAMVKEYITLHGGSIKVESEPEKGSCFIILLPVIREMSEDVDEEQKETETEEITDNDNISISTPLVLLVEDNDEFRSYLKDSLKKHYKIEEAQNGKIAWKMMLDNLPDLVVSDIMMPVMDGIELCKKIKSDRRTSQIPVILLTAKSTISEKIEGYETGADDYITKPFSFEILESRIFNLIQQRKKLLDNLRRQIEIKPSDIEITSVDEKLIFKTISIIEKNMSNPDFSVEELSRDIGMSRVNLYKKLVSLTGKTPIEFIRTIRLKRAAQLLEKSQLSVSEIAYQVGFNNPKYFARYFKDEFKILPSQYAKNAKDKDKI